MHVCKASADLVEIWALHNVCVVAGRQMDMKKALAVGNAKEEAVIKAKPEEEEEEEDPESQLLMEMAKIKERMEAKTKKEKKRIRKEKKASKIKMVGISTILLQLGCSAFCML